MKFASRQKLRHARPLTSSSLTSIKTSTLHTKLNSSCKRLPSPPHTEAFNQTCHLLQQNTPGYDVTRPLAKIHAYRIQSIVLDRFLTNHNL